MTSVRFRSNILPKLQDTNHNLQASYELSPLITLERTVENISHIVPDVAEYVSIAMEKCRRDFASLTWDESAAIYLYTMPKPFFSSLNIALRDPNRQALRPWLSFLRLLMSALEKLPYTKATIWRGVDYDATLHFVNNNIYTLGGM